MADKEIGKTRRADSIKLQPLSGDIVGRLDRLWGSITKQTPESYQSLEGIQVDDYLLERTIGSGAFGVVYLARDLRCDREVALKFPRPDLLSSPGAIDRFESEARASSRLQHGGIVPVYDVKLDAELPYIASAYCPGLDLAKWLDASE